VVLTVQEDQIEYEPSVPLPTNYWTRPIPSVNGEWYQISGNWLGLAASTFAATGMYNSSGNFNPYTKAPNTAHVVWTKTLGFGGLIGGEFGNSQTANYYSTSQYEPKFAPIIINGVLYYTEYVGASTYPAGWQAVDLRTGETIWTKDTSAPLSCGQTYNYISPNQYGALAYLWTMPSGFFGAGGPWAMYDANTGDEILTIENGQSVRLVEATDGSLLGYYVNSTWGQPGATITMWNSSKCILDSTPANPFYQESSWMWRPTVGAVIDFDLGVEWSVPIPTEINGVPIGATLGVSKISGDVILLTASVAGFGFNPGWQAEAAVSKTTGQLLWGPINRTIDPAHVAMEMGPAMDGMYTSYVRESMEWTGYSLANGNKMWGPVKSTESNSWAYYGINYVGAYGNIYAWDYGGTVNCIDIKTGDIEWSWSTGSSGYETPYGIWPLWTFSVGTVADNKLYVPEGHMYSPPLFHGAKQLCIDATNGHLIWSMLAFDTTSAPAIADGYMVTLNAYDNRIYCWGKGQTLTTVSAPQTGVPKGSSVVISGTVTDQSPGAKGTPAICDADMSTWMEYIYVQQPMPNARGVDVVLDATDATGEITRIGTATTDMSGFYSFMWKPPAEGKYTILATFEGTESYFSSYSETAVGVDPAADEMLTPLENSVSGVEGSVTAVEGSVSDLDSSVSAVEGSVSGLETSVDNVASSVSGLEDSVGTLESSISNLSTYLIAILALVIVAIVVALYSVLKPRK